MRTVHGMTHSRLMNIWKNMKQRCNNPKNTSFKMYGAKGIEVCDEWQNSSAAFFDWALNNGYSAELTIDRIDSKRSYEPSNCRWITKAENTRRAATGRKGNNGGGHFKFVEYNGKSQTIKDWARELDIPYKTLHRRLTFYNWSTEKAFNTPVVIGGLK